MHISKPWWDGGLLIVNAINSTAGLFAGDAIEMEIEVKAGGEMLVTSPSASRAYRMPSGMASVRQLIRVEAGGWLELLPAVFIPHAGSDYFQETAVELESAARFLAFETFAPGRVAFGEAWGFRRFENRFEMRYAEKPLVRDVYTLTAQCASVQALREIFPTGCHATCHAVGGDFSDELLATISELHHPGCWVGCTRLDAPGVTVRMAAADHIQLRRALARVRDLMHQAFRRPVPPLRRT